MERLFRRISARRQSCRQCIELHGESTERRRGSPFCVQFGIMILLTQQKIRLFIKKSFHPCLITLRPNTMFSLIHGFRVFRIGIRATAIFLLGETLIVDNRTNHAKSTADALRKNFGSVIKIYRSTIPMAVKVAEVASKGVSIYKYEPSSPVAKAYAEFAKEVSADGRKKERLHSADAR